MLINEAVLHILDKNSGTYSLNLLQLGIHFSLNTLQTRGLNQKRRPTYRSISF